MCLQAVVCNDSHSPSKGTCSHNVAKISKAEKKDLYLLIHCNVTDIYTVNHLSFACKKFLHSWLIYLAKLMTQVHVHIRLELVIITSLSPVKPLKKNSSFTVFPLDLNKSPILIYRYMQSHFIT